MTKENFDNLIKTAKDSDINIKKTEVCLKAGFNKDYSKCNYRDCLYYTTICLIAEKKGVDLLAILNLK
jgi:hypothetical protein